MSFLEAIAVTFRTMMFLITVAMWIGHWRAARDVLLQRPGWKGSLSTVCFLTIMSGISFGSIFNVFPDAGWFIARWLRLAGLNVGMAVIVIGMLTVLYRQALRSGPDKARKAFLSGFAMLVPAAGFVALLMTAGAHG